MTDHQQVVACAQEWQRAIEDRDVEAAARILDDDFALVLVWPAVAVLGRTEWLRMLPDYLVHDYEIEDRIVDTRDDLALIVQRVRMTTTVSGADRDGTFVISDVWRRNNGTWRVWRRHSTPLSAEPARHSAGRHPTLRRG